MNATRDWPVQTVGIDTRNTALTRGTGVATYAAVLARCLPPIGRRPHYVFAHPQRSRAARWLDAALPLSRRLSPWGDPPSQAAPDLFRTAQVHFDLWGRLRPLRSACPPDLMHWTYPLPLRLVGRPNLYTIHDLIPLLHPTLTGIDGTRFGRMLARIAGVADRIVTVSDATRREVIDTLQLPPDRVVNTWQAVDVSVVADSLPAGLVRGRFWLHVGATDRRKNLRRLIEAWRASGSALPLVLAGPDGDDTVPRDLPGVLRLPWSSRPALLGLIRGARALLMPSLAEGFGLPVVEALALGTPVLTSGSGALAEVSGGAALLVDPADGRAITTGLRALDDDEALRGRLRDAGLIRAMQFTPDAYAARLGRLYDDVVPRG